MKLAGFKCKQIFCPYITTDNYTSIQVNPRSYPLNIYMHPNKDPSVVSTSARISRIITSIIVIDRHIPNFLFDKNNHFVGVGQNTFKIKL